MDCAGCGSSWFIEEHHVIPSYAPPMDGIYTSQPAPLTRSRYVYRCVQCSLAYGEAPKASPQATPQRKRKKAG